MKKIKLNKSAEKKLHDLLMDTSNCVPIEEALGRAKLKYKNQLLKF